MPAPRIPPDPTCQGDIAKRLIELRKKAAPRGLPEPRENTDATNTDFPVLHNQPRDRGWLYSRMITGSGGGPLLHETDFTFNA